MFVNCKGSQNEIEGNDNFNEATEEEYVVNQGDLIINTKQNNKFQTMSDYGSSFNKRLETLQDEAGGKRDTYQGKR
jgi:hypothetical protein